jgi:hypothetical protein
MWRRVISQSVNAAARRPRGNSHKQLAPDAKHVTTFERRRRLDLRHLTMLPNKRRNPGNFCAARIASGPGQDGELIEHQRCVFKKARIRTLIVRWNLIHIDSEPPQHFLILLVLLDRPPEVNRRPVNKRKLTFPNTRRHRTRESSQHRQKIISARSVWVGHSLRLRSGQACPTLLDVDLVFSEPRSVR